MVEDFPRFFEGLMMEGDLLVSGGAVDWVGGWIVWSARYLLKCSGCYCSKLF